MTTLMPWEILEYRQMAGYSSSLVNSPTDDDRQEDRQLSVEVTAMAEQNGLSIKHACEIVGLSLDEYRTVGVTLEAMPTPEKIAQETRAIRATWTPSELRRRNTRQRAEEFQTGWEVPEITTAAVMRNAVGN